MLSEKLLAAMTQKECLDLLKQAESHIKENFEVRSMSLFGSTARGSNTDQSDVDLFINMPPNAFKLIRLGNYLEHLLGKSVDLVRDSKYLNPVLLKEIEKDGISIF